MNEGIEKINDDINNINIWIKKQGMSLNPTKTMAIIIGSKQKLKNINELHTNMPKIKVESIEIEYSKSVKYLGVHINETLSAETHVDSITKRVNFTLSKIKHCRNTITPSIKLKLIKSVVNPIFDYGSILYHGFKIHGTGKDEDRVQLLQNSCIRYICNLTKRDLVSEKYTELKLLNAYNRRSVLICGFIHSFIHTKKPIYLSDIFKVSKNNTRAGIHTITLTIKKVKLTRDQI